MEKYNGGRGQKSTFTAINLSTLEDSKKTFAEVIRAYGEGEISENMGRSLTYMLAQYLNYWKLERDMELEEEIKKINERMEAMER